MKITYLGPTGATFSEEAYRKLAQKFGAPPLEGDDAEQELVERNEGVVPAIIGHGGYGAIAMETKAEGRVEPPLNSFIELLGTFDQCPLRILGAGRMRLHFALVARSGLALADIRRVIGHPKALGACKRYLGSLGVETVASESNGKAAEQVALNADFAGAAATAPRTAAEKYGLAILSEAIEDEEASTVFFLLGPLSVKPPPIEEKNRALLAFRLKHIPGALVRVLQPFAEERINLLEIHSLYRKEGEYDFAIETECGKDQIASHSKAVERAIGFATRHLFFGPFPLVTLA